MHILKMPEFRKLVEAYRGGYLSFSELKKELEGCWEKTIQGMEKTHLVEGDAGPASATEQEVH